jgi:hypothetical protein
MLHPIFIPSRGRAQTGRTAKLLRSYGVPFRIVVEPQDFAEYCSIHGDGSILRMEEHGMGIAHARNWIKRQAISEGYTHHWQIDDNIGKFLVREGDRNMETNPAHVLEAAEKEQLKWSNVQLIGLKHAMFAFAARNEVDVNAQIYSCFCVRHDVSAAWRGGLVEDTDFSLQVLKSGACTILMNRLIIQKAASAAMRGGNTEIEYAGGGREKRAAGLIAAWPGWFHTKKGDAGRVAPSKVWSSFKQRPVAI